jgi:(2R)-ethylmalonyl-CoA mutase
MNFPFERHTLPNGLRVLIQPDNQTPMVAVNLLYNVGARDEDPDVIGLSILSGSHLSLVTDILELMKKEGLDIPVILGGIIPEGDRDNLRRQGIAAVYTPKDFDISRIMNEIAHLVAERRS